MNRQPYGTPPRWWAPVLTPWWVRISRGWRQRQLARRQQIVQIDAQGFDRVKEAALAGKGVLVTPNHSAHYDSAALYLAADRVDLPLYTMAAWQVFAMCSTFESWAMQRLGCFSVDREGADRQAFKQAVDILRQQPHPLVIFPEGDIYHVNDRVVPFREGAAAIALSAAKRAERPIVVFPTAIKFFYVDDPTDALHGLMDQLEERLYLRPQPDAELAQRIHRFAEAALALKELDYLGHTCSGRLRERVVSLTEAVLSQLEQRHDIRAEGTTPERVKVLRKRLIDLLDDDKLPRENPIRFHQLQQDMEDVFFVAQCFSYPGDYLVDSPSIERMAETADKFEEDVLGKDLPTIRGRRRVVIQVGEPIEIETQRRGRDHVVELTQQMQQRVQEMLGELKK